MKYRLLLGAAGLLMLAIRPAYAVDSAVVVSDCSTITAIPAGQMSGIFMDTTGHLCTNATSAGNVTITAPLGSQPAATSVSVAVASDQINLPIPAGTNLIGKVGIDQTTPGTTNAVQANPGTSGGLSFATITAANSTNATNLKATPGQLYHITGYSAAAVPTWVSFYNNSGTPTCGTNIVYQMLIPVNSTSGGGAVDDIPPGLAFSTGIGYCITTGIAGTGSVAASSIVVNFGYK